jgi:hypothetical protein
MFQGMPRKPVDLKTHDGHDNQNVIDDIFDTKIFDHYFSSSLFDA